MIVPDPEQPRKEFQQQELEELTASIRSRGIKQPLTVRWEEKLSKYMIIDGGRRFVAATRLKLEELPCWIQQGSPKEVLVDQIVNNWQRSSLRPYETADALVRLRNEFGLSQQQLAELTGKPKGEISKLLALRDKVVPEVQELARSEDPEKPMLTKRHLYNIARLKPSEQKPLADQVRLEGLTAVETERLVATQTGTDKQPTRRKRSGVKARQRRFATSKADVLMTFRSAKFTDEDVLAMLEEMRRELVDPKGQRDVS